MRISESQLRKIVRQEILESIETPEYTAKRGERQAILKKFKDDRDAIMQAPVKRGVGFTPGEKQKAWYHGEALQELGEELVNVIEPAYDEIKSEMDKNVEAQDRPALRGNFLRLRDLIYYNKLSRKTVTVQVNKLLFPSDEPLQAELTRSFKKILRTLESAETLLKRMKMTPAQQKAADATSTRMRMGWVE